MWFPPSVDQPLHSSSYAVVMANSGSQSACRQTPPMDVPTAIKTQLQCESTNSPHKGYSRNTQLR